MYHAKFQANNLRQYEEAQARITAYNTNPRLCLECQGPILAPSDRPIRETMVRQYCSQSCAAKMANRNRKRVSRGPSVKVCPECNLPKLKGDIRCFDCWQITNLSKTKAALSHPQIRSHARTIMKPSGRACELCGYSKFVEVCHVRPVEDFPPESTLGDINAPTNLRLLCPNCHWEFDHGLLDLA